LWVDAGVRELERVSLLAAAGVETVVVGLETVAEPSVLMEACQEFGERIVFSLDLKGGVPLGDWAPDPWEVARTAIAAGARRLLVLDLAHVGGGAGTGTAALCARLAAAFPQVEVSTGGGVGGADDVRRLKECGVRAALVASALHDGALTPTDLMDPS
jgi:phosphoribosylformimino-5-aminoimidazole carboxamide ribotide isomerase